MDKIDFKQELNLLPTFDSNPMSHDNITPLKDESFPLEIQDGRKFSLIDNRELLDFVEENAPPTPKRRKPRKRAPTKLNLATEKLNSYVCELCDENFHLPNLLRLHKRALHVLTKPYQCGKCPQQFNVERNFEIHAANHVAMPAVCFVCGKCFRRTTGYHGHLLTHMVADNFCCKKCGEEFEYEEYFRRHSVECRENRNDMEVEEVAVRKRNRNPDQNEEETGRKFQCDICDKRFTRPSNLARHQATHSQSKQFQCTVCEMRFSQKSSLDRHNDLHLGVKDFKCPKCSMNFSQSGNLRTHMARVHPKNPDLTNKFPCPDCSCIFSKLNALNRHSAKVHAIANKQSRIDSDEHYSIDNVMAQLKHLQNDFYPLADSSTENCSLFPNKCVEISIIPETTAVPVIEDESSSVNRLVKIVETLNPQEEKSEIVVNQLENGSIKLYQCEACSKSFQRPSDLLRHNRVHTKEKPYDCGICGRCFSVKHNLHVHLRTHGKDANRVTNCYECPDCFKLFSSMRRLDMHAESHGDRKLFPCKICGKSFRFTRNLRIHRCTTHRPKNKHELELRRSMKGPIELRAAVNDPGEVPTIKRYQYSICDLKFKKRLYLAQHEAGTKRFQCQTCRKTFMSQRSLNTHHRIHLDHKKTKQCNECDAQFWSNTELKRHRVVHSSKRPILCPYCGKSFKTKASCRVHIFTHAKDLMKEKDAGVEESDRGECVTAVATNDSNQDENVFYVSIELPGLQDRQGVQTGPLPAPPQLLAWSQTQETVQAETLPHTPRLDQQIIQSTPSPPPPPNNPSFIEMQDLIKNNKSARRLSKMITVHSVEKVSIDLDSLVSVSETDVGSTERTSAREHVCEICRKSFRKPIDYRRHQLIHTKEKPFECDICHKPFRLKGTLDHHRRTHGEKRELFDCQVCGKKYTSRNVLKVHLRIHTNERPYNCPYCPKTFRTSGHRAIHVRMHLKVKETEQKRKQK